MPDLNLRFPMRIALRNQNGRGTSMIVPGFFLLAVSVLAGSSVISENATLLSRLVFVAPSMFLAVLLITLGLRRRTVLGHYTIERDMICFKSTNDSDTSNWSEGLSGYKGIALQPVVRANPKMHVNIYWIHLKHATNDLRDIPLHLWEGFKQDIKDEREAQKYIVFLSTLLNLPILDPLSEIHIGKKEFTVGPFRVVIK